MVLDPPFGCGQDTRHQSERGLNRSGRLCVSNGRCVDFSTARGKSWMYPNLIRPLLGSKQAYMFVCFFYKNLQQTHSEFC